MSALVDVLSHASDCSGETPPFSSRTRSRFPLPPARNPENIDDIMLWFEGRKEELGEALRLMREQNTVQPRARVAVRRTTILEEMVRVPDSMKDQVPEF